MVSLCFPWYLKVMTGSNLDAISIFYVMPSTFEFIGIFERCIVFFFFFSPSIFNSNSCKCSYESLITIAKKKKLKINFLLNNECFFMVVNYYTSKFRFPTFIHDILLIKR